MRIDGTKILALPRDEVWRALNDTAFLARTVPGCSRAEETSPGDITMALTCAVGPIRVNFDAKLRRLEVKAPESYVLEGGGSAGVAGSATGRVRVQLQEVPGGTQLHYEAQTEITGRIAQLGARLIDSTARKFAEEFFANVVRELSGAAPAAMASAPVAAPAAALTAPAAASVAPPVAGPDWRLALDGLAWRVALGCAAGSFVGTLVATLLLRAAA
jgi:hypothetical protein